MEARIKELKLIISDTESSLKDQAIMSDNDLVKILNTSLDEAKKELEDLEAEAEKAVEKAKNEVDAAKKEGNKGAEKKAKKELKDAIKEEKEVEKLQDKVESTEKKVDKAEKKAHGGAGRGQGRKPNPNKVVKVKGQRGGKRVGAGRKVEAKAALKKTMKAMVVSKKKSRKLMKPAKAALVKKSKEKSIKAFGQTVTFKNDAEFCSALIKAFKKRRSVYKAKGKRTRPVFGIITANVKNAVSKAMHSVSAESIAKNPKQIISKFQRLETKAIAFLDAFKDVLGSDFKKSEISKDFGDIDAAIKNLIKKYKGK